MWLMRLLKIKGAPCKFDFLFIQKYTNINIKSVFKRLNQGKISSWKIFILALLMTKNQWKKSFGSKNLVFKYFFSMNSGWDLYFWKHFFSWIIFLIIHIYWPRNWPRLGHKLLPTLQICSFQNLLAKHNNDKIIPKQYLTL